MSEITRISLNNIRKTSSLFIDDIGEKGASFTVRKLGAGEELDLSLNQRRLGEILDELNAIDFSKYDTRKEADVKELNKITKRAKKLNDEILEIQKFELETFKRCFTDTNDGKDVDELVKTLTVEERSHLFQSLFNPIQLKDESTPANEAETPENGSDEVVNA